MIGLNVFLIFGLIFLCNSLPFQSQIHTKKLSHNRNQKKNNLQSIIDGAVKSPILNPSKSPNAKPKEDGKFHEGDMILKPSSAASNRNALTDPNSLWTDGIVPYELADNLNTENLESIRQAMADYATYTCIKFQPRKTEKDYIRIISDYNSGCSSHVGRQGGVQTVSLANYGCAYKATAIHELMHALGFSHEQNRSDRDKFVTVNMENIEEKMRYNFDLSSSRFSLLGHAYDYNSVMHYGSNYFSKNGLPTIQAKDPSAQIGQRLGFSLNDVKKLNTLYKCDPDRLKTQQNGTTIKNGLNKQYTFNQTEIESMTQKLNAMRKSVGASNMRKMTWNNDLANVAKSFAEKCNFDQEPTTCGVAGYAKLNLIKRSFDSIDSEAGKLMDSFWSDYNSSFSRILYSRTLFWAESKEFGCGIAQCGNTTGPGLPKLNYYAACYFGQMNFDVIEKFKNGTACSACSATGATCEDNLCSGGKDSFCPEKDEWSEDTCKWISAYKKKTQNSDYCAMCDNGKENFYSYLLTVKKCGHYCKIC